MSASPFNFHLIFIGLFFETGYHVLQTGLGHPVPTTQVLGLQVCALKLGCGAGDGLSCVK